MKRRDFFALLGGLAVWSHGARAQQKAMPVIGFLGSGSPGPNSPFLIGFHQGLSESGYIEGRNVTIEYHWAEGYYDRLPALAADFVDRKVDVIAAMGGTPVALVAKNATSTIPVVFIGGGDLVADGLVASLARPGGNLTGFTPIAGQLTSKRFELLTEVVPQAGVVALLVNPKNAGTQRMTRDVQEAALAKQVRLDVVTAGTEGEIDAAFASLVLPSIRHAKWQPMP